jgi:predicted Zn-dependent protease
MHVHCHEVTMTHSMTAQEHYDACIETQREGKVAQSMEMLRKMTVDFPDFALAYNALAALFKKENNIEAAIENMEKYCLLEPTDPFGFSVLSAYCIVAERRAQAEDALGHASELRLLRFIALREKGRFTE